MLQLGGDFVVDARNEIAFAHRMRDSGDRAPVERIVEALRAGARLSRPSPPRTFDEVEVAGEAEIEPVVE